MKKRILPMRVRELSDAYRAIDFPAYQREPTVWSLAAKRRLIDSMLRQFDIGAFYFYDKGNESFDCVDGRQRIGAIMSFLGVNDIDTHNGFSFTVMNEMRSDADIYKSSFHPFSTLTRMNYDTIRQRRDDDPVAARFLDTFLEYRLTIVILSDSKADVEFNLQFARLNLGTIINSGEKLHAMVGWLRDVCFAELGRHPFLQAVRIRTRRFAREQLAAQIMTQVCAVETKGGEVDERFVKMRYEDLQTLFKDYRRPVDSARGWVDRVATVMDGLEGAFQDAGVFKSQAMVLSVVMLAYDLWEETWFSATELAEFIEQFLGRLAEQLKRGLDYEERYRYLIEFQLHVTQASVERAAVVTRAKILRREFMTWRDNHRVLRGDVAEVD